MQLGQEGRLPGQGQHPLLYHRAFHVIILDHHVLLQDLHGVELICALPLREHDLQDSGHVSGVEGAPGKPQAADGHSGPLQA